MKSQSRNQLIAAILMTLLGILFIVLKNEVIRVGMTVLGVMLLVQALFDVIGKQYIPAAIKAVIGVLVIVLGWVFVKVAIYIMAAVLLIYAILQLVMVIRALPATNSTLAKILGFVQPVIYLVISCCLLFNQGGTMSWVFIISGIFLIIQGVLALIASLVNNR